MYSLRTLEDIININSGLNKIAGMNVGDVPKDIAINVHTKTVYVAILALILYL